MITYGRDGWHSGGHRSAGRHARPNTDTAHRRTSESIKTARDELLGELGSTTDPRVVGVAQAVTNAVHRLAEAAGHLRSAVDSAGAFASELGLPARAAIQSKVGDAVPISGGYSASAITTRTIKENHTYAVTTSGTPGFVHNRGGEVPALRWPRTRSVLIVLLGSALAGRLERLIMEREAYGRLLALPVTRTWSAL